MQPFFGYPGGKSRAVKKIKAALSFEDRTVIEPFCGGASFSLSCNKPAWINDLDPDLICLWLAVRDRPAELCDAVREYRISADLFYVLKEKLSKHRPVPKSNKALVGRAIDKLVVHKISYSNMGEMAASPVGGKNQTGKWKFDVRWNVDAICKKIAKTSHKIQEWYITCRPFEDVLRDSEEFVFIDPPYYEAGAKCYKNSFDVEDHIRLAEYVRDLGTDWAITYDDCPEIRELYSWAKVDDLEFKYFMSSAYRSGEEMKTGQELIITNPVTK